MGAKNSKHKSRPPKALVKELVQKTCFDRKQILELYEAYNKLRSTIQGKGVFDNEEFEKSMGLRPSQFSKRLFEILDLDGNGELDFDEFVLGLSVFDESANLEDKIKFVFQIYDLDGNGEIDHEELKLILKASLDEAFLIELSDEDLDAIVKNTFDSVDTDKNGTIDYEEFLEFARKNPRILDNLKITLPKI